MPGSTWLVASHNVGKCDEYTRLLGDRGLDLIDARGAGITEPEETADTFEGNARLKVTHALHSAPSRVDAVLADDTGLCVDALGGEPGVHTKRWAMARGGWESACAALCDELGLRGTEPASPVEARFVCVVGLARPGISGVWTARAEVRGKIRWPPVGEGPGFVPVFSPSDAELFIVDGVLAHRRRAFEALWRAHVDVQTAPSGDAEPGV
jgi:XTP/dITP diphosphohydrolase